MFYLVLSTVPSTPVYFSFLNLIFHRYLFVLLLFLFIWTLISLTILVVPIFRVVLIVATVLLVILTHSFDYLFSGFFFNKMSWVNLKLLIEKTRVGKIVIFFWIKIYLCKGAWPVTVTMNVSCQPPVRTMWKFQTLKFQSFKSRARSHTVHFLFVV